MEVTENHKKEIERRIVDTIIQGLEQGLLKSDDIREISQEVLDTIDTVTNHDDLIRYLGDLSSHWGVFTNILTMEQGEISRLEEHSVTQKILELSKSGKIEEALALAKTITHK